MGKSKRRAGESDASSSQPTEDDEPRDLRGEFNCPFLIRNDLEGRFYERWKRFDITPPHVLDWALMTRLNCSDTLERYLSVLGLKKYAHLSNRCSKVLTLEFLSTLDVPADLSYCEFRLHEVPRRLSVAQLSRLMGFHPTNIAENSLPSNFNPNATWTELTGFANWDSGGMPAGFLRDNVLSIVHKFIAYAITGKEQANKVNFHELFLLHCATNNIRICADYFLLLTFKNMLATTRYHATLPLVISAIGRHFGVFDPDAIAPDSDIIFCTRIDFSELKSAKIITADYKWCPARRRKCVMNHRNELAAAAANPPHETEDAHVLDDTVQEDEAMADAYASGPFSSFLHQGSGSSSSNDLTQLSADVQSLRTEFGEFRTDFGAFRQDFGAYTDDFRSFRQDFSTYTNDFRSFRQDFGELRTDIYQRQDRVEQQVMDTHSLVLEQNRNWQLSHDQAALHYQQVEEKNRLVAALNQQWANWALHDPPPPPDQQ